MNNDMGQPATSSQPTPPSPNISSSTLSTKQLPATSRTINPIVWFIAGCAITLLAVGGYWQYSQMKSPKPTADSAYDLTPTPAVVPMDTPQPSSVVAGTFSMRKILDPLCKVDVDGSSKDINLNALPFIFSQAVLNKYTQQSCFISTISNSAYVELYSPAQSPSEVGPSIDIGDQNSAIEGLAQFSLALDKVKTEVTEPLKVLPVNNELNLVVMAAPQGHPCQPTDKNIVIEYRVHKEKDGYVIVGTDSVTVTDTTPFLDLLQKYGTPHTVTANDSCEFGQAYDFYEQDKTNAFSTEFMERYFSSYDSIPAAYKPEAQALVNDVMGVNKK